MVLMVSVNTLKRNAAMLLLQLTSQSYAGRVFTGQIAFPGQRRTPFGLGQVDVSADVDQVLQDARSFEMNVLTLMSHSFKACGRQDTHR